MVQMPNARTSSDVRVNRPIRASTPAAAVIQ